MRTEARNDKSPHLAKNKNMMITAMLFAEISGAHLDAKSIEIITIISDTRTLRHLLYVSVCMIRNLGVVNDGKVQYFVDEDQRTLGNVPIH